MDSIFNLEETRRSSLLQQIIESFGFAYVCLWSHFPQHSNCLIFIDGVYKEENNQTSSSSGSLALRSFLDYQKSMFLVDNYSRRVPGFAFMHNRTYMECKGFELSKMASNAAQLQFYQTAIFMGCDNGEIELGMSKDSSQINFEIELKKSFPGDFPQEVLGQSLDQTRPSSSSSSLRSLSMENSADYPPFLFNMLQTTSNMAEIYGFKEPYLEQQAPNQTPSSSTMRSPEDALQQTLNQIRTNQKIPSREHEEEAMTRAILAAISSSSPASSSSSHQRRPPRVASAFKRYRSHLGPTNQVQNRQSLTRRSLSFFRNLNEARAQQDYRMAQTTRPTTNQLHHMMSERKRREKLNESFQALRSVLPPGSKKDKASVLSNIKEYIGSLKSQVEELKKRNKILEAEQPGNDMPKQDSSGFSGERLIIRITDVEESTSESQVVDVEVNVRGALILGDLVVRILEFMKQVENVTVMSIDARTQLSETTQTIANRVVLRLRIQGSEWDRSNFQEAMKRVLDDLAQ
ncbi:putative transcription factor bHLH041 isoform X2 [Helianthus annuus]|uniref:Putative basic helix-loop-helix (BHLH) DNA-binding family protein n=1 Tax=Helianthus annuus TaxID=4232 RepID=A0A251V4Q4_HELAN|nr:putative transcription factor bHLH041 isoform X2 [Helianthus annuus]